MSEAALKAYEEARVEQLTRNEARRIRTKVSDARKNPESAGRRWPFELLQNAHDAGPYQGRDFVQANVTWEQTPEGIKLIFEHDGAPFSLKELAALLSGGSSKDFESEETTGRFGTGFLVTHALAAKARVQGLLENTDALELFDLTLDRSGDEEEIIANIENCNSAILSAISIDSLNGEKSARFEYLVDNINVMSEGLTVLREALPYLFATCPKLGSLSLCRSDEVVEIWRLKETKQRQYNNSLVEDRLLEVRANQGDAREHRSVRIVTDEGAAVIAVVQRVDGSWRVCLPAADFPRVFRRFPIQSYILPVDLVLDGNFDVDQERQRLHLTEENKKLLSCALNNIPDTVAFAYEENWEGKHLLARIAEPAPLLTSSEDDKAWWRQELSRIARVVATMPIVESRDRMGPALQTGEGWWADFVLPRLNDSSQTDDVPFERVWPLVNDVKLFDPPELDIAERWTQIANGWAGLGLEVYRRTLEDIADAVKNEAKHLDDLPVNGDRKEWLVRYLDTVGECWEKRQIEHAAALDGLLPDQHGRLLLHKDLRKEDEIPEQLKDIAASIGIDIRSQLLDKELYELSQSLGLRYLPATLNKLVPDSVTEDILVERCVNLLAQKFVEGKRAPADQELLNGSVRLLSYLWNTKGRAAEETAKRCPLIAADETAIKWANTRMMMAPVSAWHAEAQPFSGAYPPQRILSPLYGGDADIQLPNVVPALVSWGMAIADPLTKSAPEVKDKRLKALAAEGADTDGITVSGIEFSHIALLHDVVILRCQEGVEEAKQLLGMVLKYIARYDDKWHVWLDAPGRKERADVTVRVRGAVWVADLTSRAWVPVEGEEGSAKALATYATIKNLLEPEWLINNDSGIALLNECFGFDALESRLLGVEPERRQDMRDGLARLVDVAKNDPDAVSKFADELEEQQRRTRDVARWRQLGLAVQEAVKSAVESHGLEAKLVDRGFDYEVFIKQGGDIEEADIARMEIGSHFLEVKATTQGEIRMTPAQAAVAAGKADRYILCVVDLRGIPLHELDRDWKAEEVEAVSHVVTDIGTYVRDTKELVDAAKASEVGIRNDTVLRYGVPVDIWNTDIRISGWVASMAGRV